MSAAPLEAPAIHHVDGSVVQASIGALEAQRVIEGIQGGRLAADHAWLLFAETAATHGWKSAACRAVVLELAKRLRRADAPEGCVAKSVG